MQLKITCFKLAIYSMFFLIITACSLQEVADEAVYEFPTRGTGKEARPNDPDPYGKREDGLFGKEGIQLFNTGRPSGSASGGEGGGGGIGVNAYLWRATLDTISFMPVSAADAFGGTIITDWHSQPEAPDERFKINVYILGRSLRADGVKVAVFRQIQDESGWRDASLPPETGTKIEDAILTKARQLRSENQEISRLNSEEVKSKLKGAMFVIFGCPIGSHGDQFFKKNALF